MLSLFVCHDNYDNVVSLHWTKYTKSTFLLLNGQVSSNQKKSLLSGVLFKQVLFKNGRVLNDETIACSKLS